MTKPLYALITVFYLLSFVDPAAAASPLVPEFEQFCLARDLTPLQVETQARAQGYVAAPPQLLGKIPPPLSQGGNLLWKSIEGSAALLVVTENISAFPYLAKLCVMGLIPGTESDVSDFEKMIGFSPAKTPGGDVYLFREIEGRRIPAPAAEARRSEVVKGDNVLAGGFYEDNVTVYMIARPLRQTPRVR